MAININKKEGDKLHAEEWNELAQEVMSKQPRLNIVDALNSDSSVDVLSAKQGKVLDEKINSATSTINGISEKVDKLPTGYYYGQFDSVSGLPDASQLTQKGYAYVASEDPSIYYIYLFNGEGSTWEDSGNKFVTTSLETDLETKSATKAPTTEAVKEGIEAVDITATRSGSTELSAVAKYNAAANINDRAAVVVAETGVVKALGYKVLNPAMSFAEQVTEANTVYEIKDEYNLNGGSVTIPINCALQFNGGKLKNGTLSISKGVNIKADDTKIFDGINFTNDAASINFHIDWFVGNYASSISESEPDATLEIQTMLNSGIKKVWLTNKHHYKITDTLIIPVEVSIDGQKQLYSDRPYWKKYIFAKDLDKPLIEVQAGAGRSSSSIRNIYLYRLSSNNTLTAENEYKKAYSTVYYNCTQGSLWGIEFDGEITGNTPECTFYAADETTTTNYNLNGYTAFEIYASGLNPTQGYGYNYATYINLRGYVHDYYRMFNIHTDTNNWITEIHLNFDGEAVFGGYVASDFNLGGAWQSRSLLGANEYPFVETEGICNFTGGGIWDISATSVHTQTGFYTTRYQVKASSFRNGEHKIGLYSDNMRNIKAPRYSFDLCDNTDLQSNLIPNAFFGFNNSIKKGPIYDVIFKVFATDEDFATYENSGTGGTDITASNTTNYEYLFYPGKLYYDNAAGNVRNFNADVASYVTDANVKVILLKCKATWLQRATALVFAYSQNIESITITTNSGTRIFGGNAYFDPKYAPLAGNATDEEVKFVIKYKTTQNNVDIPYIAVAGVAGGDRAGSWGANIQGNLNLKGKGILSGELTMSKTVSLVCNKDTGKLVRTICTPGMLSVNGTGGSTTFCVANIILSGIPTMMHIKYETAAGTINIIYLAQSGARIWGGYDLNSNKIELLVKANSKNYFVLQQKGLLYGYVSSIEAYNVNGAVTVASFSQTLPSLSGYEEVPLYNSSGIITAANVNDVNAHNGTIMLNSTTNKLLVKSNGVWRDANGETVGLQVSDTSVLIGAAADSSVTINVYHANALTVSALNPDNTPATWLTVPSTVAVGTNTLTISAAANEASNPRGAKVIIEDSTDVVIVNVVQNYSTN